MKLQPLMTMHADLDPVEIGTVPYGKRAIYNVTGGSFEGERLRGKAIPGGADWFLVDNNDVGRLDVRITLKTQDDAYIYVQYFGVLVMNDKVKAAMAQGTETEFGDTYFITQPHFETGDARYAWLNRVIAVGEGRVKPNAVEYQIFEVLPS